MTGTRLKGAGGHLKWDITRRFIELTAGEFRSTALGHEGVLAAVYPEDLITVRARKNPKKPGTLAHQVFELYRSGQTVAEFVSIYGTSEFLRAFNDVRPIVKRGSAPYGASRDLLPGLDRHSWWAKRVRTILGTHVTDLGGRTT